MSELTEERRAELRRKYNLPDLPPYVPMDPDMVNRAFRAAAREARIFAACFVAIPGAVAGACHRIQQRARWRVRQLLEPECPGPDCLMCNGAACNLCGAGCWNNSAPFCDHASDERHEEPNVSSRNTAGRAGRKG